MSAIDTLKRAPKWAWFTAAGVSAGVVGIRLYKGRAAPSKGQVATDGSTVGDTQGGSVQPATGGGSPPGVIVPPIITGGDGASSSDIAAAIAGVIGGGFDSMTGLLGAVVTGDQQNLGAAIGSIGQTNDNLTSLLAGAGSAPQPAAVNPSPITINLPSPSKPPVAHPHPPAKTYPTWEGHTLNWWHNPTHAKKNGKWNWPYDHGKGYSHSHPFSGNLAATGHTTNPNK